ncbi:unnamed protein product [Penicillium salamii]|uniref:Uncharacterized protein n=1 Tax=Penicillium salamii TaxID=1612424 RepID=A0A9W4JL54_9EURO|nr:unnamed protein product [Penicillium salamii]CAG8122610.1 unnamed protein product [Penicillium salamii]CAG8132450.1 unnamed protein product [Penicillium salamii]CAG8157529.1 unnamed protein product [Penicillium salamii]CAG8186969.1 unnamed protein product [Penicillium salamii]
MSKPSESDVILNRANVALSRSQRLVASWLPQTDSPTKTDEELQKEEDEIFTAVPETLGIGAPLPQKAADGSWNRSDLDSNDKLRKQLLGKNYDRVMKAAAEEKAAQKAAKAIPEKEEKEEEEEYDEEDGRSAMLSKQREKKRKGAPGVHPAVLAAEAEAGTETDKGPRKGRKKATSYLDELLAERSKKRKKR